MSDREIFQENLRRFLSDSGAKQIDLAKYTGVSDKTVSAWFTGRAYPRADVMEKICKFFGVRLSDMVDSKQEQPDEDAQLLAYFHSLNSTGKSKLLERAEELVYLYGEKSSQVASRKVGM
jgi:transcriptional regulator with XRE-family HTH domain